MDIWQSGRRELVDKLNKVCDRIGASLVAELDHEKNVLVHRDELRLLQDKAERLDELGDEVSILARKKPAQDASLSDLEALHEKNAENNRLVENNARLVQELEVHKASLSRVDGLERENKQLAAKLEQALQQVQYGEKTTSGNGLWAIPMPSLSEPLSSALRIEGDESSAAPPNKSYEHWIRKYNKLYQHHADMASAREQLEKALSAKKEGMRKYQQYYDHLEKKIKKRDAQIQEKDEELRHLREQVRNVGAHGLLEEWDWDHMHSIPSSSKKCEVEGAETPEVLTTTVSASPMRNVNLEDGLVDFNCFSNPMSKGILRPFYRIGPPEGTPIPRGLRQNPGNPLISSISGYCTPAMEHVRGSIFQNQEQDDRTTPHKLPLLLFEGDNAINGKVAKMDIEVQNSCRTSSIDGELQHTSPARTSASEIKEEHPTETPTSQDTPVVISKRNVGKREGLNDTAQPNDTPRVKVETVSSSPIGLAAVNGLDESIDLDDIGEKQVTPRKGRAPLPNYLNNSLLARAARIWTPSQDRSHSSHSSDSSHVSPVMPTHQTRVSGRSSVLQPQSPNKQILPRTSTDRATKRRKVVSNQAIRDLIEEGQVIESVNKTPMNTPTPEQVRLLSDLLAMASPREQTLVSPARVVPIQPKPRQSGGRDSTDSSRVYESPGDAIQSSETSDPSTILNNFTAMESVDSFKPMSKDSVRKSIDSSAPSSTSSKSTSLELSRPCSRGIFRDSAYASRLPPRDEPKGNPGTSNPSKALPRTPSKPPKYASEHVLTACTGPQTPPSKAADVQLKAPESVSKVAQLYLREQTTAPIRTQNQARRTRPLNELTLQDFKVNPAYNQGCSYAFNAVVRNQEERRCLQGCTKLECCGGKFRALAEATRNPDQPLTLSQEEADEQSLKEFLGDNSYKLRNMTKDERYETLIQARAREMSNKYGKHRHAYERRKSPPGYWRSDFPNTQEEIQDRARAQQMERDQIAQRYGEAMRPGGAYTFRDE